MKVNLFYSHNLQERIGIINRSGEFISRIKQYNYYISLYVVENQFVEVYFSRSKRSIEAIEILDPLSERLYLYVEKLNFLDLF